MQPPSGAPAELGGRDVSVIILSIAVQELSGCKPSVWMKSAGGESSEIRSCLEWIGLALKDILNVLSSLWGF